MYILHMHAYMYHLLMTCPAPPGCTKTPKTA